ncbi:unnamed protein product [Caenorhabditis auriculariae]|uniref:Uncharacterized protein n=1 Tax=Caenorhabditis auriculariae TaxID=2777116 RepID=A0A8S1HYC7_9PELO|nr:unnamed protein product [Caenorhabditis auriculariae]
MRFSSVLSVVLLFLLIQASKAGILRFRRAVEDNYGYNSWGYNNAVSDRLWGGPTSLGWAQVPHTLSPMFSPIFGRK